MLYWGHYWFGGDVTLRNPEGHCGLLCCLMCESSSVMPTVDLQAATDGADGTW